MTDYQPLAPWAPTLGERARIVELYRDGITDPSPAFERIFLTACADAIRHKAVPQLLLAAMGYGATSLLNAQGHDLTVARMSEDLAVARGEAAQEALWQSRFRA